MGHFVFYNDIIVIDGMSPFIQTVIRNRSENQYKRRKSLPWSKRNFNKFTYSITLSWINKLNVRLP